VKKEVERFERARIERKINEIQKQKGINNLKQYKNIDILLKEEELPGMNFHLEKKYHKETIDTTLKKEKKIAVNQNNITRPDFKKTMKNTKATTQNQEVLLNIEVNIDDSNRVEKLEIYPSDDPLAVVDSFCKKFGLSDDKKLRLQKVIEEKLSDNAGLSSNRS